MTAWDDLPADHSPFKVVCLAREVHRGSQLCERGGAVEGSDGFVSVAWKPRAVRAVPESGTGYPKGGQLGTDLNRDRLVAALAAHGVQPVRQVSIDQTWSALRFRPVNQ